MTWFRRGRQRDASDGDGSGGVRQDGSHPDHPDVVGTVDGSDADDAPERLLERHGQLVRFINAHAGALPVEGVVIARDITDTVRGVIDTAADRELDIYAIVSINGIVNDYLPTTLRAYLNLDSALTDRQGPSGRTPRAALREQLDSLSGAADDLLQATHSHDVDALFTQGNFLRTKFSRSDLDL